MSGIKAPSLTRATKRIQLELEIAAKALMPIQTSRQSSNRAKPRLANDSVTAVQTNETHPEVCLGITGSKAKFSFVQADLAVPPSELRHVVTVMPRAEALFASMVGAEPPLPL